MNFFENVKNTLTMLKDDDFGDEVDAEFADRSSPPDDVADPSPLPPPKPADKKQSDTKPADTKKTDTKPASTKPDDTKSDDTKSKDTKSTPSSDIVPARPSKEPKIDEKPDTGTTDVKSDTGKDDEKVEKKAIDAPGKLY